MRRATSRADARRRPARTPGDAQTDARGRCAGRRAGRTRCGNPRGRRGHANGCARQVRRATSRADAGDVQTDARGRCAGRRAGRTRRTDAAGSGGRPNGCPKQVRRATSRADARRRPARTQGTRKRMPEADAPGDEPGGRAGPSGTVGRGTDARSGKGVNTPRMERRRGRALIASSRRGAVRHRPGRRTLPCRRRTCDTSETR